MKQINELESIWENHGVFDLLKEKYHQRIMDMFDWENIEDDVEDVKDVGFPMWENGSYKACYIGTVFNIFPSGKYYTPWWTTNQTPKYYTPSWTTNETPKEVLKDRIFEEELEGILDDKDMWYESGVDDPTDIFFCKYLTAEEKGGEK